jgi:hypothetical protein
VSRLDELIEQGDLDELTREIDALCERRDWDGLVTLRDRCRAALERGKQLWPAAAHAEYRLALEAPGPWAGPAVSGSSGRFTLGPLSEVAASTHPWSELRDHLDEGPSRIVTAHERVVRGDDLSGEGLVDDVFDLPFRLADWEPQYPVAVYHADRAEFPAPSRPALAPVDLPAPAPRAEEPDGTAALADLTRAWTEGSNGRTQVVAVAGDALGAIAALGVPRARVAEVPVGQAAAAMAWAAASGGAHGRRRGMAAGRFGAWWVVTTLAEDPTDLAWYAWDVGEPDTGWTLHLAVEHPADGLAWAVTATDQSLL